MLTIRSDQITEFEQRAIEDFVRRAVAHLRKELRDRVKERSEAELVISVRDAVQRAALFDLRTEKQIMYFVDAETLLGVAFYEAASHLWAKRLLTSNKLNPDDKASLLLATACSLDREQLRR